MVLTECAKVRQHPGEPRRRWFQSADLDLIVWFDADDAIHGFQLCYDRSRHERALTWTRSQGYSHLKVDDGEGVGLAHKRTPILVADGTFEAAVVQRFRTEAAALPPEIAAFVAAMLAAYPA